MSTITLGITAYDKDIYLLNRLLSHIFAQTIKPNTIIVFCSGVDRISLPKSDVPISVIIQNSRCIQAVARNIIAKTNNNDMLMFFDIDDIPHPQKIESTIKLIDNYDFLVHSYIASKNPNALFEHIPSVSNLITYNNLTIDTKSTNICYKDRPIHHSHITVKKHVFNHVIFNEDLSFYRKEDGKFCQDLLNNGYKGVFVDYPMVIYT